MFYTYAHSITCLDMYGGQMTDIYWEKNDKDGTARKGETGKA